ncbi:MAG TPA: hypothetical protein VK388_03755 [Pyrinomonadaceae bacterium]|nr:hypothetical protein [Pyrinomonadaceae bacterium]
MPKALLYGLMTVVNFIFAYIAYNNDRMLFVVILSIAGLLMAIAAIGTALGVGGGKPKSN